MLVSPTMKNQPAHLGALGGLPVVRRRASFCQPHFQVVLAEHAPQSWNRRKKKPRRQQPEPLTSKHGPLETGGTGESTGVPKDTATPFEAQLLKVVLDLRIQNEQLQQQMREMQVSVGQVLRHVVSLKHQEEQARFGEQPTPQEMARPEPPELFLMPICDMEEFRAAEARLKNPADRTLLEEQLLSLGDGKTLQKVVREMVGRLLSKQVQERFSLLGYRGKS